MANQRRKGLKQLTFFEWEHNQDALRAIAKRENCSLSELLRRLTKEITEKYGENYKSHEYK